MDHERSRIAALKQYDVLDTPREDTFDRVTAMTARLFSVQIACITLVDEERFYFKSAYGIDVTEAVRQPGFCDTVVQREDDHCVENTAIDSLVKNHSLVLCPPHIRFYAGSPLRTDDGFVIGTLCIMDQTARVFTAADKILLREMAEFVMYQFERRKMKAEAERRKDEERKIQKFESLGVLTGGVAHDFNNLLVAVMGSASLADSQVSENSPVKESLASILSAAKQGKALTDQLLAYAGERPLSSEPFDLSKLLGDLTPLLHSSLAKGATFELDCSADLPIVIGDATQLRQVILNLVTNASEAYEDRTGSVLVRLSAKNIVTAESESAIFGDLVPGQYVLIEVIDQGCGMDADTAAAIFDPFYSTKSFGRGLGMSIVQRIIRGHGGIIRVKSEKNQGCKISVYLPANSSDLKNDVVQQTVSDEKWTGDGKVLVVDDEDLVVRVISSAIRHLGFDVIGAHDGTRALELLGDGSEFEVVVLDATLSGMSGPATLDEVKKQRPGLPVVITSGHHVDEVARQFPDFENLTFLQKPWTVDGLAGALRDAITK